MVVAAMMDLDEHYGQLLGVKSPWAVGSVDLNIENHRVDVDIEYIEYGGQCPECGKDCPRHDLRKERVWRHLDTMQFTTYLHCEVPRVRCKDHGVKTVSTPWADKHSGFTLLFEDFAIRVLTAARSVEEARKLLSLNWHQANAIKARAVERGLKRRKKFYIRYLGVDEKQFRHGHNYISNLYDLEQGRVLEVVEDRTEEACKLLIDKALTKRQCNNVTAVAMDMWKAYENAVTDKLPNADIVHDRFHISQHLNQAVDKVRRKEHAELLKQGDTALTGTKYQWTSNGENIKEKDVESFNELKRSDLKVSRAWAIKELFRRFWDYSYVGCAERHYKRWYSWAIRSRLEPIKKEARMIKNHLPNIMNYFKYHITNAVAEGLNSKIQTVKANARGYRSFESFRISILFYCGKLDMSPIASH